ncbi:MAG: hypothetical protein E7672_06825 [Ruminococcaceae bacterium]|nr:hypothetical protein [Oscillospiraceae bacterium]
MNDTNLTNPLPLPPQVKFVLSRLERAGYPAYAVGGCVRDHLMGRTPGDYDVTTGAKPEEILDVFSDSRVVETGLKHGTVTIVREGMNIETTTYRIDGTYDDGRHPDSVTFTDKLSDDLMRRDFTINAMAYSPERGIVDLYGGCEDIDGRVIRCVGCAKDRFSEDGLRILRALRFSSTLGFTPDDECDEAIRELTPLLEKISRERIFAELSKLICGQGCAEVLSKYASVIAYVIPKLNDEDVKRTAGAIKTLDSIGEGGLCLRYALLFSSLSIKDAGAAIDSLKTSREEKRGILDFLRHRESLNGKSDRYAVKRLISETSDPFPAQLSVFLASLGDITPEDADHIAKEACDIAKNNECRSLRHLAIGGEDLKKLGLGGQSIGKTLSFLLDSVMRGETENKKDRLIEAAAEYNKI